MNQTAADLSVCTDATGIPACVRRGLVTRCLLEGVKRLGLAVSGGADSVALFHLMLPICAERRVQVVVVHFDHGLRRDSAADARFVSDLAKENDVRFVSERASGLSASVVAGMSVEMAAREKRLSFFARCVQDENLDAIATGHQADDVAETLLLRLARGAGATGLAGLRPRSPLGGTRASLIRPLLSVTDSALKDWLRQHAFSWREDASNADESVPRNFVRRTLIPQLEQNWIRDLRARLCQSAEILREDDAALEAFACDALRTTETERGLDVTRLNGLSPALGRRVVRMWLFKNGFSGAAGSEPVIGLLDRCRRDAALTWRLQLAREAHVGCREGFLRVIREAEPPPPVQIPIPGSVRWGDLKIVAELSEGLASHALGVGRYPAVCALDRGAALNAPLMIRARTPGDRIAPTGLGGSKKIQDLFVDQKVPEEDRDRIPLFVSGEEIAWVPGYRIARSFAVPSPQTPSVRITVAPQE